MNHLTHTTAKPSHYNQESENYDTLNEESSLSTNSLVEHVLQKYRVKRVLDMTCGTGSQVLYLAKHGYEVVGSDINAKMLKIATQKAKQTALPIKLIKGDVRTLKVGQFDAVVTIFNAIGHLTKTDFTKAMRNIHQNLKPGGIYVFDIFNLSYLLKDDNITKLTIDWLATENGSTTRKIQYSTINVDGILASYTTCYDQTSRKKAKLSKSWQTLQVYSAEQLKEMLQRNGFKLLRCCSIDGTRFNTFKTERMLLVAKKPNNK